MPISELPPLDDGDKLVPAGETITLPSEPEQPILVPPAQKETVTTQHQVVTSVTKASELPLDFLRDPTVPTELKKEVTDLETKISNDRWKNRRRMAYISLFSMIVVTMCVMFPAVAIERLRELSGVIIAFYTACGAIIGTYIGFATYDDVKSR